jgi:hypothetical protein
VPPTVIRADTKKNKEANMTIAPEKRDGFRKIIDRLSTLTLIGLMVLALVALPHSLKVNAKSTWIGSSLAMADDDGDSDGTGDDGGSDSGSDSDSDDDGDDADDGDDGDDGDEDDGDDGDDSDDDDDADDDGEDSEHAGYDSSDSRDSSRDTDGADDGSNDGQRRLVGVDGVQGLFPVSSDDEEDLVGNWGKKD